MYAIIPPVNSDDDHERDALEGERDAGSREGTWRGLGESAGLQSVMLYSAYIYKLWRKVTRRRRCESLWISSAGGRTQGEKNLMGSRRTWTKCG